MQRRNAGRGMLSVSLACTRSRSWVASQVLERQECLKALGTSCTLKSLETSLALLIWSIPGLLTQVPKTLVIPWETGASFVLMSQLVEVPAWDWSQKDQGAMRSLKMPALLTSGEERGWGLSLSFVLASCDASVKIPYLAQFGGLPD